jgi:hypothetical protein
LSTPSLALTLLVTGIGADHAHHTMTLNDLAVTADTPHGRENLHKNILLA